MSKTQSNQEMTNPNGKDSNKSKGSTKMDVNVTNIVSDNVADSTLVRVHGTMMSPVNDTMVAQYSRSGHLDGFVNDVVSPMLPLTGAGRTATFLLTKSPKQRKEIFRHQSAVDTYARLHGLLRRYFDRASSNILGYVPRTSDRNSPYVSPKSFMLGDYLKYLGDLEGAMEKMTDDNLRSLEKMINLNFKSAIDADPLVVSPFADVVKFILKTSMDDVESGVEKKEGDVSTESVYFKEVNAVGEEFLDKFFSLASEKRKLNEGTLANAFKSKHPDVKIDDNVLIDAIKSLIFSKIHNVLDIYMYTGAKVSDDEASEGLKTSILGMLIAQFLGPEDYKVKDPGDKSGKGLKIDDSTTLGKVAESLPDIPGLEGFKTKNADGDLLVTGFKGSVTSADLASLAQSVFNEHIVKETARSFNDMVRSLMFLHNLRIELTSFIDDSMELSKSSFETINSRFLEWRSMANRLLHTSDPTTAEDILADFLANPTWSRSMAGQVYRLSIGEMEIDALKISADIAKLGEDDLYTYWDKIGANAISTLEVKVSDSDPSSALSILGAKEYKLSAKPISVIGYSKSKEELRSVVQSNKDFFGRQFPEAADSDNALALYRLKFFASMADPEIRTIVRNKTAAQIDREFAFEKKGKDSFLDRFHRISTSLAVELAAYRYALETSVDLHAYSVVDFFDYMMDVINTDKIMNFIPVPLGGDKSALIQQTKNDFIKEYKVLTDRDLKLSDKRCHLNKPWLIDLDASSKPKSKFKKIKYMTPDTNATVSSMVLDCTKRSFLNAAAGSVLSLMKSLKYHGNLKVSPRDASHVLQIQPSLYAQALQRHEDLGTVLTSFDKVEMMRPVLNSEELHMLEDDISRVGNNIAITTVTPLLEIFEAIKTTGSVKTSPSVVYQGDYAKQKRYGSKLKDFLSYGHNILNLGDVRGQLGASKKTSFYSARIGADKYDSLYVKGYRALSSLLRFATERGEWNAYPAHYQDYELELNYRGFTTDDILSLIGLGGDVSISREEYESIMLYISSLPSESCFPFVFESIDSDSDTSIFLKDILKVKDYFAENGVYALAGSYRFFLRSDEFLYYLASDKITSTPYDYMELSFSSGMEPLTMEDAFNHVVVTTVSVPKSLLASELRSTDLDRLVFEWMKANKPIVDALLVNGHRESKADVIDDPKPKDIETQDVDDNKESTNEE